MGEEQTEQTGFIDQATDRVQSMWGKMSDELEKLQDQVNSRREELTSKASDRAKKLQSDIKSSTVVKRAEKLQEDIRGSAVVKRAEKLQDDIRNTEVVKRAEKFTSELTEQIEKGVESGLDTVLGMLHIASRSDLDRLDKKLSQMNRKLAKLTKAAEDAPTGTNGSAPPEAN